MGVVDERPLSACCVSRDLDPGELRRRILALIEAGADVGEVDKNGVTPLHHAVRFRNPVAVEVLLAHGAEVNAVCKRSGATALHRAATYTGAPGTAGKREERLRILGMLLAAGADPGIRNRVGKRAVDYVRDGDGRRLLGGG